MTRRVRVGYAKLGRAIPLTLDKCGHLGGDVELSATLGTLARRNPGVDFVIIGRNKGVNPQEAGLPSNVTNPWATWADQVRIQRARLKLNKSNLTIDEHYALQDMHDSIMMRTFLDLDQIIIWAGQHGTTNTPVPRISDPSKLTKPYDWSAHYCSYLIRGINMWRANDPVTREEIWLNSDVRNYLKCRDLAWPLQNSVLTQYNYTHQLKHERYGDATPPGEWERISGVETDGIPTRWVSQVQCKYARLEINGLMPGTPFGNLISYNPEWTDRSTFGLFINETRKYVKPNLARINVLRDWVLPLNPAFIHGTWSKDSLSELGMNIAPASWEEYYPKLHSVRCTFTTPASGTGFATAKPWEAFAAGTVCFFSPDYDTQNNILRDAPHGLSEWLRVKSPTELEQRVRHLSTASGRRDWEWVISAQRRHFDNAVASAEFAQRIESRLDDVMLGDSE